MRNLQHQNLAVELLRMLLADEIRTRRASNVVRQQKFSERLVAALNRYPNQAVKTAQVLEELLTLAREVPEAQAQGRVEKLGSPPDEVAFYDALGGADLEQVMGDGQLLAIARDVARTVRENATIDWAVQEKVRANMRRMVRRTLNRLGYPPERREDATATVGRQAELLAAEAA